MNAHYKFYKTQNIRTCSTSAAKFHINIRELWKRSRIKQQHLFKTIDATRPFVQYLRVNLFSGFPDVRVAGMTERILIVDKFTLLAIELNWDRNR